MTELIVVAYDSVERAEEVRHKLLDMQHEYLVSLNDAVIASLDEKGRVKLNQLVSLWGAGATYGSFWGLLVGLLFLHPIFGVVAGAAAGAIGGALTDFGIDDDFMKKVAASLKDGRAALFIMARNVTGDRVVEELTQFGGDILRTNLDTSQEAKLRAAFDKAREQHTPVAA